MLVIALWPNHAAAGDDARWQDERQGARFMLGGGAEVLMFGFIPNAGAAYVEPALHVGLAEAVDFRLGGMLGFGGGVGGAPFLAVMPGVRPSFRFNLGSVYTIWLGFAARAGLGVPLDGGEEAGLLLLYGPELSLLSFRFGERQQLEFDVDGGAFLPPIWGARAGLALRYLFR